MGIYSALEGKYYEILDRLDAKLPVYKVVDPIDKVVPSFLLLIAIGIILIGLFVVAPILAPPAGTATLEITVEDESGKAISGAAVEVAGLGREFREETGAGGTLSVEARQGAALAITVSKEGYSTETKQAVAGQDKTIRFVLSAAGEEPGARTIKFADAGGRKLSGIEISAEFSCSSGAALEQGIYTTSTGEITITPPAGCGTLIVRVVAGGYRTNSYPVSESGTIGLEAEENPGGRAVISVKDSETMELLNGIGVSVYDYSGMLAGQMYSDWGETNFELLPGEYSATAEDESLRYGAKTITFSIEAGGTIEETILLSRQIRAKVEVKVRDAKSKAALEGAEVFLRGEQGGAFEQTTVEGGKAEFALGDADVYYVSAGMEGYVASGEKEADIRNLSPGSVVKVDVDLEPCTPSKCGLVRVRVTDEDELPVENATVALFEAGTDFWARAYGRKGTDVNGTAGFSGVRDGNYYAIAQKYPATGTSDAQEIRAAQAVNEIAIKMVIGRGILRIRAVDADNRPVPFADAEIRTETGEKLGTLALDANGAKSYEIKADKRVYVVVSKEGYAKFTSTAVQIMPGGTIEIVAKLEEAIIAAQPRVILAGVFENGKEVQRLKAGGTYIVRLQIEVPDGEDYTEMGLHVRTGESERVEKDKIFINWVNAPNAAVLRGTTYTEPNGYGTDAASITNADAKWANITWQEDGIEPGIYNVEVEVKVRAETTPGYALPFFYRAWAVSAGEYLRDPLDERLGYAQETSSVGELYANTYAKNYYEGVDESCDEKFCYSERVVDLKEGLNLVDVPYRLRVFDNYSLIFSITNNSGTVHDNANFRVRNTADGTTADKTLSIENYALRNADEREFSSSAKGFEIEAIDAGYFTRNRAIRGEMTIQGKAEKESNIQLAIVSENVQAFSRLIPFSVYSGQDIAVEVKPDVLAAFADIELKVHVAYLGGENDGFDLEDALVRVRRIAPDKSESAQASETDKEGNAKFNIPASSPGTRIIVEVEKPGFASKRVEGAITKDIVSFSPETLSSSLDVSDTKEEFLELGITNLTPVVLNIVSLRVSGDFHGLLDEKKMENWLEQYAGKVELKEGAPETIEFQTALSDDALLLSKPREVAGKLLIDVKNTQAAGVWAFEVPFTVAIGLAKLPKYANCLVISAAEWKESTVSSMATKEFEITNNCINKDDEEIELRNLQARVRWEGEVMGQVELSVYDSERGETASEVLQESRYANLFGQVRKNAHYTGIATFIAKTGSEGKTASFEIEIDAEQITAAGREFVGASNAIDAEILIINLEECIELTPNPQEGVEMTEEGEEGEFTIDTSACGDIDIDFKFCDNDNCRGGTDEGGLYLRPWTIDNVNKGDNPAVTIESAEMAGIYGVTVHARPAGGSWRQIAVMDVFVKPKAARYFDLERYDFTIIGKGAKDSTRLYNYMLQENVKVKADLCSWGEAVKAKGFSGAEIAGISTGAGAVGATYSLLATTTAAGAVGAGVGAPTVSVAVSVGTALGVGGGGTGAAIVGAAVIGGIVAIVVVLILVAIMAFTGKEDCHDSFNSETLRDYVINLAGAGDANGGRYLPPDAIAVGLNPYGKKDIKPGFNLKVTDVTGEGDHGKQEVGLVFENSSGLEELKPAYSVLNVEATEHIHGDTTHSGGASVKCGKGSFGNYWIGAGGGMGNCHGSWDQTYSQRFHVRFKTADVKESLPDINFDTYPCVSGTEIGRSGAGALPRVKLNWGWNEETGGIGYDNCDANNEDYIYCDAAQFSIEVSKRLERLYEFLEANNFALKCPTPESGDEALGETNTEYSAHAVLEEKLGLSSIEMGKAGNSRAFTVSVKNNTTATQDAKVTMTLNGTGGTNECTKNLLNITAGVSMQEACEFENLEEGTYAVIAQISSETTDDVDANTVSYGFTVSEESSTIAGYNCSLARTTETYYGEPMINRFIDATPNVNWAGSAIHSKKELNDLLKFNAYLIKDAYSDDFRKDFAHYYTNIEFADTPVYFTNLGGRGYGLNKLFEQGTIVFTGKYTTENAIPAPGLYEVEIAAYFGNDWKFFDDEGKTNVLVSVVLHHLDDPYPNSPFYSLPFDGSVGLDGISFNRQGYGTAYENYSAENALQINNSNVPAKSYADAGSSAVESVETEVVTDIYRLNTDPKTRGMVLSVDRSSAKNKVEFFPSKATPVMLKMHKGEIGSEPFSAFYTLTIGGVPADTGSVLAYWSGAGSCLDFTGVPVYEKFYESPDRAAEVKDRLANWVNAYAVDWEKAAYKGDVYLRTIFYTSAFDRCELHAESPLGSLFFITPETSDIAKGEEGVALGGISSMEHNKGGSGSGEIVSSVQDVFDLVDSNAMCITSTGNKATFWWNPQKIYTQAGGSGNSINGDMDLLVAGKTCIGYGN